MISPAIFKQDHIVYEEQKAHFKKEAEKLKKIFLQTDIRKLKENSWLEYFTALVNYYTKFALFNDSEIREKFVSSGLNNFWLKWLIPIEIIEEKLNSINAEGKIRVLYTPILSLLKYHLKVKILKDMGEWQNLETVHEKENILMSKKLIIDLYRRKDDGGGIPKTYKDKSDQNRVAKILNFEKEFGGRGLVKKELFQLLSGDTNQICLRPMINYFIDSGDNNMTEYCNIIYDFFLLIIKDDDTMYSDEDEYLRKAPKKYKSFRVYKKEKIFKTFIRAVK